MTATTSLYQLVAPILLITLASLFVWANARHPETLNKVLWVTLAVLTTITIGVLAG